MKKQAQKNKYTLAKEKRERQHQKMLKQRRIANYKQFRELCEPNNSQGTLYVIGCWDDEKKEIFIKIGITSRTIQERFATEASMPYNYKILHEIKGHYKYIFELEAHLHGKYKSMHIIPHKCFSGSYLECYWPRQEILTNITEDIACFRKLYLKRY
jgi:hypothetical protein